MWCWLTMAYAAAPQGGTPIGFWHPDDLAPASKLFMDSSARLQEPFEARSSTVEQLASALRDYREALDLLGPRAPVSERTRLEELEREFQRQRETLLVFADQVVGDYDQAFTASVDRAVAARGAIVECQATIAQGPAIPGMPQRTSPNPDCKGEDLNLSLASTVDGDVELQGQLEQILARPWPTITLDRTPQQPVPMSGESAADRWVLVRDLFLAGKRQELQAIDLADDEARGRIEAAIESGVSIEELKKLEPEADRIEAETAARRAQLAEPILDAVEARVAKKWASEPKTGWCASPVLLGGCTADNASKDVVGKLLDDKKIAKLLD